jgi:hypothetical protein
MNRLFYVTKFIRSRIFIQKNKRAQCNKQRHVASPTTRDVLGWVRTGCTRTAATAISCTHTDPSGSQGSHACAHARSLEWPDLAQQVQKALTSQLL